VVGPASARCCHGRGGRRLRRDLRDRLLRAAEEGITACGPAKASLRAIARRVGVSHQATAHHFDDRAGLLTALAVEGVTLLYDRTRAAIDSVDVADGMQVIAAGAAYVEFAAAQPTMFDLMYRPELLHAEDPALVTARLKHRALMLDTIVRAQAAGWGTSVPAADLALIGWSTVHGLAVLQRDALASMLYPEVDLDSLLVRIGQVFSLLVDNPAAGGS